MHYLLIFCESEPTDAALRLGKQKIDYNKTASAFNYNLIMFPVLATAGEWALKSVPLAVDAAQLPVNFDQFFAKNGAVLPKNAWHASC